MARVSPVTAVYVVLVAAALGLVGVLAVRLAGTAPPATLAPALRPGRTLMGDEGCFSCHSLEGQGGTMGPPLGAELAQKGESWIQDYLTSGRNIDVYPGHGHTAFKDLKPEQTRQIARYLASLTVSSVYQGPPAPPPPGR
jgi:mono/diheme cytochrome c family protein